MIALLSQWKAIAAAGAAALLITGGIWVYEALAHRAEAIQALTTANAQLITANADGVQAVNQVQQQLKQTTDALTAEKQAATDNAALTGQLQERISHAPRNGCIGPASSALLDGLRTAALNRRSQVPQPVTP